MCLLVYRNLLFFRPVDTHKLLYKNLPVKSVVPDQKQTWHLQYIPDSAFPDYSDTHKSTISLSNEMNPWVYWFCIVKPLPNPWTKFLKVNN